MFRRDSGKKAMPDALAFGRDSKKQTWEKGAGKALSRGVAWAAAVIMTAAMLPASTASASAHTHSFYSVWESDSQNHWHAASCGHKSEKDGLGPHSWNSGVVTEVASPTASGMKKYTCTICGAVKREAYSFEAKVVSLLDVAYSKSGKLWLRTETPPKTAHDTPSDPNWSVRGRMGCTAGKVRDAQGNQYTYGFHLDDSTSNEKELVVYLDGEYTRMTGVVAFPGDPISIRAGLRDKTIWIYRDDERKPVFACMDFGKYQEPVEIDIDVTGVIELRIVWAKGEEPNEAATIYDAYLYN